MSAPEAFHATSLDGGGGRRRVGLLAAALVVFLGVAIAKPWGPAAPPSPILAPSASDQASQRPSTPPASPAPAETPSGGPIDALPVAFTTPAQPKPEASWTGLRWRRLSADDPMSLLTSVVRVRTGFVAIGLVAHVPATPVWTSRDGSRWEPLPFATGTTFWPGSAVLGVAELPRSLVAVTESTEFCGEPCTPTYVLPIVSWTSSDGRRWAPHVLPPEWLSSPAGKAPLLATGSAGLLVASSGEGSRLATSRDGAHWQLLAADAFPAGFALDDIRGTVDGYVAAGRWQLTGRAGAGSPATMWSADGVHWPKAPTLLPAASGPAAHAGTSVVALVPAQHGFVAVGERAGGDGQVEWWQSADGRRWRSLADFGPLGRRQGTSVAGAQPNGSLACDGRRLVALRVGADAAAWISGDGLAWRKIAMSGDVPGDQTTRVAVLPGGVLVTDGATTWFGEALVG